MAVAAHKELLRLVSADGETIADSEALRGTWSTEQYLRITDYIQSRRLIEFTDGMLEVLPMPTERHQLILQVLFLALFARIHPRGKVFFAPLRLKVREGKFREPDLLAVLDASDPRRQDAYWLGADLVMEVVSPDSGERDAIVKRTDYAEGGIPEYWIVNPIEEMITVLRLSGDQYTEHGVFERGDTATSALLKGFSINVAELFDAR